MSSVTHLAAALIVIFVVFVVAVTGKLFHVRWRRRSFNRRTSHPPSSSIRSSSNQSPNFPTVDQAATKEMLYFFCLKPNHHLSPEKNTTDGEDQMVDVFKLLEANGPAKFLCTIKEEDKEDVESKPDVDFPTKPDVCVQLAEEPVAEAEEVAVTVDGGDGDVKTEFSTPCDSPSFFTPAGSPSRDHIYMETKVDVNIDDR